MGVRRQKISKTEQSQCPKCGSSQWKAKRSVKGKVALGLAAPKSQVECVGCGKMFRRG